MSLIYYLIIFIFYFETETYTVHTCINNRCLYKDQFSSQHLWQWFIFKQMNLLLLSVHLFLLLPCVPSHSLSFCLCYTLTLTHPPSSPPVCNQGARCLVRENVPTYQKAPGFWVEAAKRRKRSSWIQWVRIVGWEQSCEERWLIPAAERQQRWKGTESGN